MRTKLNRTNWNRLSSLVYFLPVYSNTPYSVWLSCQSVSLLHGMVVWVTLTQWTVVVSGLLLSPLTQPFINWSNCQQPFIFFRQTPLIFCPQPGFRLRTTIYSMRKWFEGRLNCLVGSCVATMRLWYRWQAFVWWKQCQCPGTSWHIDELMTLSSLADGLAVGTIACLPQPCLPREQHKGRHCLIPLHWAVVVLVVWSLSSLLHSTTGGCQGVGC